MVLTYTPSVPSASTGRVGVGVTQGGKDLPTLVKEGAAGSEAVREGGKPAICGIIRAREVRCEVGLS
jgi:hypothetical protein